MKMIDAIPIVLNSFYVLSSLIGSILVPRSLSLNYL